MFLNLFQCLAIPVSHKCKISTLKKCVVKNCLKSNDSSWSYHFFLATLHLIILINRKPYP